MQEPFTEWIADLFRVSGKSVFSEGMMSTTPQRKSSVYIRGEATFACGLRTGLFTIHGDAKRLPDPRMRAVCADYELCMYGFRVIA